MPTLPSSFQQRLSRLRAHDQEEIRSFVSQYEPFIRRTLRFRIARASLQPAADSVDVCQSVMASFLIRLAAGNYELSSEEDLQKLLAAIAHKKFLVLNRRETAGKRNRNQTQSLSSLPEIAARQSDDPISGWNTSELNQEISRRLSQHELELFRLRSQDVPWTEISERMGEDAAVLRKRLSRAVKRLNEELGLED